MNQNLKEVNSLKKVSNKFLVMSLIILVVTFVLAITFLFSFKYDFSITDTVFDKMMSGVDSNNPGAGAWALWSLIIGGFALIGEFGLLLIFFITILIVPACTHGICLILNGISRLFQIGMDKRWKKIITKVLLYISTILQGLLCICLGLSAITGFSLIYIILYLILAANIYVFVQYISNLKLIKKENL